MREYKRFNIGFYDDGNNNYKINKKLPSYNTWHAMMTRCYSESLHKAEPRYKDCTVCDEWHNLYEFNKWYLNNHYTVPNQRMELDKDIIHRGNKIYNPENCVFVPHLINSLILNATTIRGEFPVGVYYDKYPKRYVASMNYRGKNIKIKYCETPVEAFIWYKWFKEEYIKEVADEYKEFIPVRLYNALYNWSVKITD